MPTRRELGGLMLGALLPGRVLARPRAGPERRFLFLYCQGGWDVTCVFAPMFSASGVEMEADVGEAEASGIGFVDSTERPSVRTFFETHGDRACVIQGLELRSIAHQRCSQLLFSGQATAADDWGSILAASSSQGLLLPYLALSGPAYTRRNTSQVVRSGQNGQLDQLLDGSALTLIDQPLGMPDPTSEALVSSYLQERMASYTAGAGEGARRFAEQLSIAHEQRVDLVDLSEKLDFASGSQLRTAMPEPCDTTVQTQLDVALTCFQLGITRCAIVQDNGWCDAGWDTHSQAERQGWNFELTFETLLWLMAELDTRKSSTGSRLADEVVVVLCSEMGRFPEFNGSGGRHHWTYTSAMLVGAGVRGGQVIGGYDDSLLGRPIDLDSGAAYDKGVSLLGGHLGATLLTLGDVDPAAEGIVESPIRAAIS